MLADKDFKAILLGRTILQMASHFGFRIECSEQKLRDEFIKDFMRICCENGYDWNILLKEKGTDSNYRLGFTNIWPIGLIVELQEKYDLIVDNKGKLRLKSYSEEKGKKRLFELVLTFQEIEYLQLISSGVYYSGVMPRVMGIDYNCNKASNSDIKYLSFRVCRTTFATVDMMDNSKILDHPFFIDGEINQAKRHKMIDFDNYEDFVQLKYLYENNKDTGQIQDQRVYEMNEIKKINEYLRHSLNTHTIAVSSNIVTSDNFLIAARRGAKSIDAGEYYCSANGQSEFVDKNVSFYKESVFEDLPSMNYHSEYRVDLNNEIRREIIAELGITGLNADFKYYGVSYLAINNSVSKEIKASHRNRRMHFNVLTFNKTPLGFKSVVASQCHATESFENSNLIGIKTIVIKNKFELFSKIIKYCLNWINKYKSRVFLILFFISFVFSRNRLQDVDVNSLIDVALLSVYLIISIIDILKNRNFKKLQVVNRIFLPKYCNKNMFNIPKILKRLSKRSARTGSAKFHGIFILMFVLYLINEDYE